MQFMRQPYTSEEIINSLEGVVQAEPSPFLYTRIQARVNAEKNKSEYLFERFVTRPAFAIATAFVLIILNGYMLHNKINKTDSIGEKSQALAIEYGQHINNPYEINETPE